MVAPKIANISCEKGYSKCDEMAGTDTFIQQVLWWGHCKVEAYWLICARSRVARADPFPLVNHDLHTVLLVQKVLSDTGHSRSDTQVGNDSSVWQSMKLI